MSEHTSVDALVLVGRGRYQDPWHDDAATGHLVAEYVTSHGMQAEVRGTSPGALDDVAGLGLLVVIAGSGRPDTDWDGDDAAWTTFHGRLDSLVRAQHVPLLALHQAANTFVDHPPWGDLIGGRWIPGISHHPPIGDATLVPVEGEDHPVLAGLGPVRTVDERYCELQVLPGSRVLLTARHDGVEHPVVWQAPGPARVLYDALGHDVRAYSSHDRRELLSRELAWLQDGPALDDQ